MPPNCPRIWAQGIAFVPCLWCVGMRCVQSPLCREGKRWQINSGCSLAAAVFEIFFFSGRAVVTTGIPALALLVGWGQDCRAHVWMVELTSLGDGTSDTGHRALAFCWHKEVWGGNLHGCHKVPQGGTAFLPPCSSDRGCLAVPPQCSVGTGEM